jgi:signal transduction histidine kinase
VSYVKRRLDLILKNASENLLANDDGEESTVSAAVRKQIATQATEQLTGMLLHEISPIIGMIKSSARRETHDFENTQLNAHLNHLTRVLEGVKNLKKAASAPQTQEFDLVDLISELVGIETQDKSVDVSLQGPRPLLVTTDPQILRLAVANGLRNAVEAVSSISETSSHPIVVAWGSTDVDTWIVILDSGPGIVGPPNAAFTIGASTKRGHSGLGLAIVRQAMETLEGTASLQQAHTGGARLELRWDK